MRDLQPKLSVNYCKLLVVTVDDQTTTNQLRDQIGAEFPFLIDDQYTLNKDAYGVRQSAHKQT
ncbi:MAG: hypothetical protein AAF633_16000 [Chloroflexota bacterium]